MLAVNLLRRVPGLSVAVLDKGPLPGRGLAYGTKYDGHLLNVPAGNMSALPEEPDHFLRDLENGVNRVPALPKISFPRPLNHFPLHPRPTATTLPLTWARTYFLARKRCVFDDAELSPPEQLGRRGKTVRIDP